MLLDLVTEGPPEQWMRLFPPEVRGNFDLLVSSTPVEKADFIVVRSTSAAKGFSGSWTYPGSALLVGEPPEVDRLPRRVLDKFDFILGPQFRYLEKRRNSHPLDCSFPARVGLIESEDGLAPNPFPIDLGEDGTPPHEFGISAITSCKRNTRLQKRRLALLQALSSSLDNFYWFGRGVRPVPDKGEVLSRWVFHLAAENSIQPGYWTEKLIDPILAGNIVFYLGTTQLPDQLDRTSIIHLPVNSPDNAKRVIRATLSDYLSTDGRPYRRSAAHNRRPISRELSFGASLIRALKALLEKSQPYGGTATDEPSAESRLLVVQLKYGHE